MNTTPKDAAMASPSEIVSAALASSRPKCCDPRSNSPCNPRVGTGVRFEAWPTAATSITWDRARFETHPQILSSIRISVTTR